MIYSNDNLSSGAWLLHAHAASRVPTSHTCRCFILILPTTGFVAAERGKSFQH